MRAETIAFKEIVWKQNRPLSDLLNAQFTHLTPRLTKHYGLPAIAKGEGPQRYDLNEGSLRAAACSRRAYLARRRRCLDGHAWLFVMRSAARRRKDPPPCVDTTRVGPAGPQPAQHRRETHRQRQLRPHKFEPLAFGLERFDGLGSYFEKDNHGNRLREDGQIRFRRSWADCHRTSGELMNHLAASDRVRQSITWKLTQYALGRPLGRAMPAPCRPFIKPAGKHRHYANLITPLP